MLPHFFYLETAEDCLSSLRSLALLAKADFFFASDVVTE